MVINPSLPSLMCHPHRSPASSRSLPSHVLLAHPGTFWPDSVTLSVNNLFSPIEGQAVMILLRILEQEGGGPHLEENQYHLANHLPRVGLCMVYRQGRLPFPARGEGANSSSSGCSGGPGVQGLQGHPLNVCIAGLKVSIVAYQSSDLTVEGYELSLLGDIILLNILVVFIYF